MSKDNYTVLKYKILVYLYGVFKKKYPFIKIEFEHYIKHEVDDYIYSFILDKLRW